MNREDVRKLLGGYAAGILTAEEQQALFQAALDDQELFDALAREQSLRDLLADPTARAHLLAAVGERSEPWYRKRWIPAALAAPALVGMIVAAVWLLRQPEKPLTMAVVRAPRQEAQAPAVPPPAIELSPAEPTPAPARARRLEVASKVAGEKTEKAVAAPAPPAPQPMVEKAAAAPPVVTADSAQPIRLESTPLSDMMKEVRPSPPAGARQLFFATAQNAFLPAANTADAANLDQQKVAENFPQQATQQAPRQSPAPPRQSQQSQQRPPDVERLAALQVATGAAQAAAPINPGVGYTILRKQPNGAFEPVKPEDLKQGDAVQLRFMPNAPGLLRVSALHPAGARTLISRSVTPLQSYTTRTLEPGETALSVVFSRQSQRRPYQAAPLGGVVAGSSNLVETAPDRVTYVVNAESAPAANQVLFTITLTYK